MPGNKGAKYTSYFSFLPVLVTPERVFSGTQKKVLPPTAPSKVHVTQPFLNKPSYLHLNKQSDGGTLPVEIPYGKKSL